MLSFSQKSEKVKQTRFISVDGPNLILPGGEKFFIRGINLATWLNPEGYMFRIGRTSSARLIDQAFREFVEPDFTSEFWKKFKDNYITRDQRRIHQGNGHETVIVAGFRYWK